MILIPNTAKPEVSDSAGTPPPLAPAPTPQQSPAAIDFNAGIPASTAAPAGMLSTWGQNPWEVEQQKADQAKADYHAKRMEKLFSVALNPAPAFQGKDLSAVAANPDEAMKAIVNDEFLAIKTGLSRLPTFGMERTLMRQRVAMQEFEGRGADSEETFHAEILKRATQARDTKEILRTVQMEGAALAVQSIITGDSPAKSWQMTREKLRSMPGYNPKQESDYLNAFHDVRRAVEDEVDSIEEPLRMVFKEFQAKGDVRGAAFDAYSQLPNPDDRRNFISKLYLLSSRMPEESRAAFWSNMGKQYTRDVTSAFESTSDFTKVNEGKFADLSRDAANPLPDLWPSEMKRRESMVQESNAAGKAYRLKADFAADVARVNQAAYDPIQYLSKDPDSWARKIESAAYAIPGAITTSAMAAIPGAGMGMFWAMTHEGAYQSYRQAFEDQGKSYEDASRLASNLAPFATLPQILMERLQLRAFKGKLPVFEDALQKINVRLGKLPYQLAARTVAGAAEEGMTEEFQNLTPDLVQSLASALGADVPGVEMLNGKNGVFDGFWKDSVGMMVTMLPLAMFGAAGGVFGDARRVDAFRQAKEAELRALGVQDPAGLKSRLASGNLIESVAAIDEAMQNRDPMSEDAMSAVKELVQESMAQLAAMEQAKATGNAPIIDQERRADGTFLYTVRDKETGDVVGEAPNIQGAYQLATQHSSFLDDRNANKVAYLATMLEAGEQVLAAGPAGGKQSFDLGDEMNAEVAAAESPASLDQFYEQAAADEMIHGGPGNIAPIALGNSKEEVRSDARGYLNRFFAGASVTTIIHEMGHATMRRLEAAGKITHEEKIAFIRAVNQVLAGKRTRAKSSQQESAPLDLLPAGIEDSAITPSMADEALMRILEAEVLRTRKQAKQDKAVQLSPGIISRNLRAIASLIPGAAEKFSAWIRAVRGLFGQHAMRAIVIQKAIRDGKLDAVQYQDMIDKLTGLDIQADHNAAVMQQTAEILGDDAPFSLSQGPSVNPFGEQESFSKAVDSILDGGYDMTKPVQMGGTPLAFQLAGANSLPVSMPPSVVKKATEGKHDLPRELLKKVITSMHDPVFIFDSETVPDAMTVILDLTHFGESILVAVHLDKKQAQHKVNLVASIYDKSNPRALERWIKNGSLRYIHTQKGREWFRSRGLQLPKEGTPRGNSNLRTEADLVKMMGGGNFSLSSSGMVGGVMNSVESIKNQRKRVEAYQRMSRKLYELRLAFERLELVAGTKRKDRSLKKEAAMREALRAEELKEDVMRRFIEVYTVEDLTRLKAMPVHAHLADPFSPLRGRLLSKSAAMKQHPDMFVTGNVGDYDGADGINRSVFGGTLWPDQAAQELYEARLIQEPTTDALWDALAKEQSHIEKMRDYVAKANEAMRDAKNQAKAEANQWLQEQEANQDANFSEKQEILRALATLDAVLNVLPAKIRGKVGGYTNLARLGSNETRMRYIQERLAMVDREMERWLKETYHAEFMDLLKRAKPQKDAPGEKPVGKIGADMHDFFRKVEEAMRMTSSDAEAEAVSLESKATSGEHTFEENAHMTALAGMIRLAGAWYARDVLNPQTGEVIMRYPGADAARMEEALLEATRLFERGYMEAKLESMKKRDRYATSRKTLGDDTGKAGVQRAIDEQKKNAQKLPKRVRDTMLRTYP